MKTDVIFLLTLAFNKKIVMGTIDILCTFVIQLNLSNKMVYNKVIMMRDDLLIVKNMQ